MELAADVEAEAVADVEAIAIDVGDHLLELLVLDLEAEGTQWHGSLEFAGLDGARR